MKLSTQISWPRIAAESIAIIASILLAFAIDAWWQDRGERKLEAALIEDLLRDFEASQSHLERWLAGNRRTLEDNSMIVDRLASAAPGHAFEAELGWVVSVIGAPTYSPTDATFQAAIASGRLELLHDPQLRRALADWRQLIDDSREDELMVRELVVEKVNPALAGQLRLAEPFRFELITGRFLEGGVPEAGRTVSLSTEPMLEAALAERLFHQAFVVDGLEKLHRSQAELIRLLEENLSGSR